MHLTSINGSANASKLNREYGLQVQSNAGFNYYKDMFEYDWSVGYLPCGQGPTSTPTSTVTGTPPTSTPTNTPATATPIPSTCNFLVNGDFETGNQAPWATTTPGITATVVTDPVNTGQFAIAVTSVFTVSNGGSQGIQQDLRNIVSGATYRVGAAVLRRASNIASARIRVTWYPCPTPGGCAGTNQDMILGNNGPNWQYITMLMTAPAGMFSARIQARILHDRR